MKEAVLLTSIMLFLESTSMEQWD